MGIGIREIDEDHRLLIDIVNEVDDLAGQETLNKERLAACLLRLIRYTRDHFEREERLMVSIRFPGARQHGETHRAFSDAIHAEAQRFVDDPSKVTARSVHGTLAEWVLRHVVQADREMIPHLGARLPVNPVRWDPTTAS